VAEWLVSVDVALTTLNLQDYAALGSAFSGLGSMLAVLGAAAVLVVEIRGKRDEAAKYAAERREQDARRRDEAAQQARLVMGEMGKVIQSPEDPDGDTEFMYIEVANHSQAFVFDVVVRIPDNDQRILLHYVAPGATAEAEFRGIPNDYYVRNIGCGGPYTPYQLRIELEFTDACGVQLQRVMAVTW
jgi:hypothetical protein